MEIPYQRLADDVLKRVIEDFVTRDGTDYGIVEVELSQKVAQVAKQLKSGEAYISYDPDEDSVTILPRSS